MRPFPLSAAVLVLAPALALTAAEQSKPALVHVPFAEGRPFAEVLRRARTEGKPVMLDVVASWCGPCKVMDQTTFADPAVVAWAKKSVVPARVDAEKGEGRKIAARYQAYSFPTVVFIDGSGHEIDRLVGAFGAVDFARGGEAVLAGKTPLLEGLAKLKTQWNVEDALRYTPALVARRDLLRLRPIALRIVTEEGDLSRLEIFQVFAQLVAMEMSEGDFSVETGDLLATFAPKLGSDPRRGFFAAALVAGSGKRGDIASARKAAQETLTATGEVGPYASDVYAALSGAEKRAGHAAEALTAARKAADLADRNSLAPGTRVERRLDFAEACAAAGQVAEGKKAFASAVELAAGAMDATLSARAARAALAVKESAEALKHARHAVELSHGEDAAAQAALAAALRATGDATGAAAALKRAAELEPENAEYKSAEPAKKKAAKAS